MSPGDRTISAFFLAGAGGLVALVVYALLPGGFPDPAAGGRGRIEVAVVLPDLGSWDTLGRGARRAAEAGVVRIEESAPDRLVLRTRDGGRTLRLVWHHPAGGWELTEQLRTLLKGPAAPAAVVGSSNSALTEAIARTLADAATPDRPAPPLLIPSGSAVGLVRDGDEGGGTLLGLHPGRSFRFCLNNERMAELLIDYLGVDRAERPARSFLVYDPADPYSADLADCFERVLDERKLGGTRSRLTAWSEGGFLLGTPAIDEKRLIDPIIEAATAEPDRATWVLLTLQGTAARRVIQAIEKSLPTGTAESLRVLAGDGIGLAALQQLGTQVGFPVLCVSSGGIGTNESDDPSDRGRVQAELIAALAAATSDDTEELASRLEGLDLPAGHPGTIGRSLRLQGGERVGDDLGVVYELLPEPVEVWAHAPGADGWHDYRLDPAQGWRRILREPGSR